ncbi:hypothetical protein NUH87_28645 [Pseudomonas batumici]|uniref:hypothetical protein n=1 Tax=Pseudomonas batumici TaxID=226910 RepID=UPI0030D201A9
MRTLFVESLGFLIGLATHSEGGGGMLRAFFVFAFIFFAGEVLAKECGEVLIITFDAELYAPESESTIEKRAFSKLYISKSDFEKNVDSSFGSGDGSLYDGHNTRALIKYKGEDYYVDRFGFVRGKERFGFLNTKVFESSLTESCK